MYAEFVRHDKAVSSFYKKLDEIIAAETAAKKHYVMFGSGIPSAMAIYYLKIHDIEVDAIIDNDTRKQNTTQHGVMVYAPEVYLENFEDHTLVMIASSYEKEMEQQLRAIGLEKQHMVRLLDFNATIADYSFVNRTNFRQLGQDELREHQLRVLKHYKNICEKNHLRYWLCGGTLLGAVRQQGYIPWDDDIDVFMGLQDLKKLTEILKNDAKFSIATFWDEEQDYFDSYSYMYETASFLDMNYFPKQISFGIGIDIFPLIGIPDGAEEQNEYIREIKELEYNVWNKSYSPAALKKEAIKLRKFMETYDYEQYKNCGYILSKYFMREIMETSDFQTPTTMLFEGEHYSVPCGWKHYLESMYGKDYMTPPKKADRHPHLFKAYVAK